MAAEFSSAYTTRNMRSSLTMMKYLARTKSEGELNRVIHQHARVEGSVADKRRRAGKLRNEQEDLEQQMSSQMHSLATSLQAEAHAKSIAKARTAAATQQMNAAAEQAARNMGAIAPHRAAAREAALSVVAPTEWAATVGAPDMAGAPVDASGNLLADQSAALAVRPGKYCLRIGAQSSPSPESSFLSYTGTASSMTLSSVRPEAANAAPWNVRMPAGQRTCTFSTSSGAKLYASISGLLGVGDPPRPDLAQFIAIPQRGAGGIAIPSPRPFSSSPRTGVGSPAVSKAGLSISSPWGSPRPQTATAAPGAANPQGAHPLVRLFHPPSRRFLHVNEMGVPSMVSAAEAYAIAEAISPRNPGRTIPPGLTFELLHAQRAQSPRFKCSAGAAHAGSSAARARASQQPATTLPLRGFDMATGTSVRGRTRMDEPLPPRSSAAQLPLDGFGLIAPGHRFEMTIRSQPPSNITNMEERTRHATSQRPGSGEHGRVAEHGRRSRPQEDETRKSAWDASQLDLSDVMAGGPLKLSSLFGCGGAGGSASSVPRMIEPTRSLYVPPLSVSLPRPTANPQALPPSRMMGQSSRPLRFQSRLP